MSVGVLFVVTFIGAFLVCMVSCVLCGRLLAADASVN